MGLGLARLGGPDGLAGTCTRGEGADAGGATTLGRRDWLDAELPDVLREGGAVGLQIWQQNQPFAHFHPPVRDVMLMVPLGARLVYQCKACT